MQRSSQAPDVNPGLCWPCRSTARYTCLMQVTVHPDRERVVEQAIASGRWNSPDEFIDSLIDEFHEQAWEEEEVDEEAWGREHRERLIELIEEGRASGPPYQTTPEEVGDHLRAYLHRLGEERSS